MIQNRKTHHDTSAGANPHRRNQTGGKSHPAVYSSLASLAREISEVCLHR